MDGTATAAEKAVARALAKDDVSLDNGDSAVDPAAIVKVGGPLATLVASLVAAVGNVLVVLARQSRALTLALTKIFRDSLPLILLGVVGFVLGFFFVAQQQYVMSAIDVVYTCGLGPILEVVGSVGDLVVVTPLTVTLTVFNDLVLYTREGLQAFLDDLKTIACGVVGVSAGACPSATALDLFRALINDPLISVSVGNVFEVASSFISLVLRQLSFPATSESFQQTITWIPGASDYLQYILGYFTTVFVCNTELTTRTLYSFYDGTILSRDCQACNWYDEYLGADGCAFMEDPVSFNAGPFNIEFSAGGGAACSSASLAQTMFDDTTFNYDDPALQCRWPEMHLAQCLGVQLEPLGLVIDAFTGTSDARTRIQEILDRLACILSTLVKRPVFTFIAASESFADLLASSTPACASSPIDIGELFIEGVFQYFECLVELVVAATGGAVTNILEIIFLLLGGAVGEAIAAVEALLKCAGNCHINTCSSAWAGQEASWSDSVTECVYLPNSVECPSAINYYGDGSLTANTSTTYAYFVLDRTGVEWVVPLSDPADCDTHLSTNSVVEPVFRCVPGVTVIYQMVQDEMCAGAPTSMTLLGGGPPLPTPVPVVPFEGAPREIGFAYRPSLLSVDEGAEHVYDRSTSLPRVAFGRDVFSIGANDGYCSYPDFELFGRDIRLFPNNGLFKCGELYAECVCSSDPDLYRGPKRLGSYGSTSNVLLANSICLEIFGFGPTFLEAFTRILYAVDIALCPLFGAFDCIDLIIQGYDGDPSTKGCVETYGSHHGNSVGGTIFSGNFQAEFVEFETLGSVLPNEDFDALHAVYRVMCDAFKYYQGPREYLGIDPALFAGGTVEPYDAVASATCFTDLNVPFPTSNPNVAGSPPFFSVGLCVEPSSPNAPDRDYFYTNIFDRYVFPHAYCILRENLNEPSDVIGGLDTSTERAKLYYALRRVWAFAYWQSCVNTQETTPSSAPPLFPTGVTVIENFFGGFFDTYTLGTAAAQRRCDLTISYRKWRYNGDRLTFPERVFAVTTGSGFLDPDPINAHDQALSGAPFYASACSVPEPKWQDPSCVSEYNAYMGLYFGSSVTRPPITVTLPRTFIAAGSSSYFLQKNEDLSRGAQFPFNEPSISTFMAGVRWLQDNGQPGSSATAIYVPPGVTFDNYFSSVFNAGQCLNEQGHLSTLLPAETRFIATVTSDQCPTDGSPINVGTLIAPNSNLVVDRRCYNDIAFKPSESLEFNPNSATPRGLYWYRTPDVVSDPRNSFFGQTPASGFDIAQFAFSDVTVLAKVMCPNIYSSNGETFDEPTCRTIYDNYYNSYFTGILPGLVSTYVPLYGFASSPVDDLPYCQTCGMIEEKGRTFARSLADLHCRMMVDPEAYIPATHAEALSTLDPDHSWIDPARTSPAIRDLAYTPSDEFLNPLWNCDFLFDDKDPPPANRNNIRYQTRDFFDELICGLDCLDNYFIFSALEGFSTILVVTDDVFHIFDCIFGFGYGDQFVPYQDRGQCLIDVGNFLVNIDIPFAKRQFGFIPGGSSLSDVIDDVNDLISEVEDIATDVATLTTQMAGVIANIADLTADVLDLDNLVDTVIDSVNDALIQVNGIIGEFEDFGDSLVDLIFGDSGQCGIIDQIAVVGECVVDTTASTRKRSPVFPGGEEWMREQEDETLGTLRKGGDAYRYVEEYFHWALQNERNGSFSNVTHMTLGNRTLNATESVRMMKGIMHIMWHLKVIKPLNISTRKGNGGEPTLCHVLLLTMNPLTVFSENATEEARYSTVKRVYHGCLQAAILRHRHNVTSLSSLLSFANFTDTMGRIHESVTNTTNRTRSFARQERHHRNRVIEWMSRVMSNTTMERFFRDNPEFDGSTAYNASRFRYPFDVMYQYAYGNGTSSGDGDSKTSFPTRNNYTLANPYLPGTHLRSNNSDETIPLIEVPVYETLENGTEVYVRSDWQLDLDNMPIPQVLGKRDMSYGFSIGGVPSSQEDVSEMLVLPDRVVRHTDEYFEAVRKRNEAVALRRRRRGGDKAPATVNNLKHALIFDYLEKAILPAEPGSASGGEGNAKAKRASTDYNPKNLIVNATKRIAEAVKDTNYWKYTMELLRRHEEIRRDVREFHGVDGAESTAVATTSAAAAAEGSRGSDPFRQMALRHSQARREMNAYIEKDLRTMDLFLQYSRAMYAEARASFPKMRAADPPPRGGNGGVPSLREREDEAKRISREIVSMGADSVGEMLRRRDALVDTIYRKRDMAVEMAGRAGNFGDLIWRRYDIGNEPSVQHAHMMLSLALGNVEQREVDDVLRGRKRYVLPDRSGVADYFAIDRRVGSFVSEEEYAAVMEKRAPYAKRGILPIVVGSWTADRTTPRVYGPLLTLNDWEGITSSVDPALGTYLSSKLDTSRQIDLTRASPDFLVFDAVDYLLNLGFGTQRGIFDRALGVVVTTVETVFASTFFEELGLTIADYFIRLVGCRYPQDVVGAVWNPFCFPLLHEGYITGGGGNWFTVGFPNNFLPSQFPWPLELIGDDCVNAPFNGERDFFTREYSDYCNLRVPSSGILGNTEPGGLDDLSSLRDAVLQMWPAQSGATLGDFVNDTYYRPFGWNDTTGFLAVPQFDAGPSVLTTPVTLTPLRFTFDSVYWNAHVTRNATAWESAVLSVLEAANARCQANSPPGCTLEPFCGFDDVRAEVHIEAPGGAPPSSGSTLVRDAYGAAYAPKVLSMGATRDCNRPFCSIPTFASYGPQSLTGLFSDPSGSGARCAHCDRRYLTCTGDLGYDSVADSFGYILAILPYIFDFVINGTVKASTLQSVLSAFVLYPAQVMSFYAPFIYIPVLHVAQAAFWLFVRLSERPAFSEDVNVSAMVAVLFVAFLYVIPVQVRKAIPLLVPIAVFFLFIFFTSLFTEIPNLVELFDVVGSTRTFLELFRQLLPFAPLRDLLSALDSGLAPYDQVFEGGLFGFPRGAHFCFFWNVRSLSMLVLLAVFIPALLAWAVVTTFLLAAAVLTGVWAFSTWLLSLATIVSVDDMAMVESRVKKLEQRQNNDDESTGGSGSIKGLEQRVEALEELTGVNRDVGGGSGGSGTPYESFEDL